MCSTHCLQYITRYREVLRRRQELHCTGWGNPYRLHTGQPADHLDAADNASFQSSATIVIEQVHLIYQQ